MELIVRAVDVGSGNTKFVTHASGTEVRCASFPSIAYPTAKVTPSWELGERRKTVCVPVGKLYYEVGPDVMLAADTYRATQLHDEYTESPEYKAFFLGALRMMKVNHIDLLVVGLPVSLFAGKKAALEKVMTGRHAIGDGKFVTVGKALAVAQPQGALVQYATEQQKMATIGYEESLIIDPGARTFDWLVARRTRLVQKQSNSLLRGMSDILQAIADELSDAAGVKFHDVDDIDLALRTGKPLVIFQKSHDVKKHMAVAESVAAQAVAGMLGRIGDTHRLQNIILVGGGAFMFRKAVKAAFAKHRIQEVKEPMFANVRGFQLPGLVRVNYPDRPH